MNSFFGFLLIALFYGQFYAAKHGFFDDFFDSDEDFDELFKSKLYRAIGQRHKKQEQKKQHKHDNVRVESRSLDQLYAAALAEGGKLVVYAGGDAPGQQVSRLIGNRNFQRWKTEN
ncbi:hypothetical protein niasHT_022939 [Heterodera trifolii]|uniref:Uncharacterized protein n=1 Tax=Heterodera trifolii TaxID=157864 RepID=A0ABD2KFL9_9BILA